jgi:hypothetical protein
LTSFNDLTEIPNTVPLSSNLLLSTLSATINYIISSKTTFLKSQSTFFRSWRIKLMQTLNYQIKHYSETQTVLWISVLCSKPLNGSTNHYQSIVSSNILHGPTAQNKHWAHYAGLVESDERWKTAYLVWLYQVNFSGYPNF